MKIEERGTNYVCGVWGVGGGGWWGGGTSKARDKKRKMPESRSQQLEDLDGALIEMVVEVILTWKGSAEKKGSVHYHGFRVFRHTTGGVHR